MSKAYKSEIPNQSRQPSRFKFEEMMNLGMYAEAAEYADEAHQWYARMGDAWLNEAGQADLRKAQAQD